MNLELTSKRVLVTGSSKGIGLAIVKALLQQGCIVVSNARSENILSRAIHGWKDCFGVAGDMEDPDQACGLVREAVKLMGGIDLLICNVGSGKSVEPGCEHFGEWQKMLGINFLTATNIIEAAKEELKKSTGVIICISSICGNEVIPGAPITYSVAKAALNAYVRGISRPFANDGIRINAVAPGNILFPGSSWDEKKTLDASLVNKMLEENVPLKKFGGTDDVTNLVLWLSSSLSSNVTGSIFTSDGGQTRT